ncbi:hypothetical protein ACFFQF_18435 [Haladaptatus pallidirubidus]|uniref:Uncharacterized protein n=1 Tax=Haladaptatus pallidirubidus TaxID=1008152 RepID=A0AAV3US28_9EURY|nr:hypothetical protein [Haladaptatus pallidirubidus]
MDIDRIADLFLGALMILLGLIPAGFFLFGWIPTNQFASDVGTVTHYSLLNHVLVQLVVSLCGLVLAAAGVLTIKYGRSDIGSDTADLY